MDGIVYATAASLGFATIENILYVLDGGLAVGIVRAIASVPGHVVFACIWGFALGTAKFRPANERTRDHPYRPLLGHAPARDLQLQP